MSATPAAEPLDSLQETALQPVGEASAEAVTDDDIARNLALASNKAISYGFTIISMRPPPWGRFLREFRHGHGLQVASVERAHLVNLVQATRMLPGIETRAYVGIDSLLRPVFGPAKQGASFGHTKIAGKQALRRGLSPLTTTVSTRQGAPVVAGSGCARAEPAPARVRRRW